MPARTNSRGAGRRLLRAIAVGVALLAGASACSGGSDGSIEPTGDESAFDALETRWSGMPSDERLLQCRAFGGELTGGPSREDLHRSLTDDDTELADLSFDDWSAFMEDACR